MTSSAPDGSVIVVPDAIAAPLTFVTVKGSVSKLPSWSFVATLRPIVAATKDRGVSLKDFFSPSFWKAFSKRN